MTATKQLSIGWARRDVTWDKPIGIRGQFHLRVSEGIIDPVSVTALALDNGDDQVIFLSADMTVVRSRLLDEIREKVAARDPAIPVLKILMNVTHTHTAPDHHAMLSAAAVADGGEGAGGSTSNVRDYPCEVSMTSGDEYRKFLGDQAADAVVEAWSRRAPGGVAWGYGYATTSHSRRPVYFDDVSLRPGANAQPGIMVNGHAVMYGDTNDPRFSHYEAGTEAFVNLLYTFDADGRLTGGIVNLPCPSQNSEHESRISADFWHDIRVGLAEKHGDIFLLPQCAAAGDLSPRILHYKKAQERRLRLKYGPGDPHLEARARKDIAERVLAAFDETLAWARKDIRTALPLGHLVKTVELSKRFVTREEHDENAALLESLEKQAFKTDGTPLENLHHNSRLSAQRNRCRQILSRYKTQDAQPKLPMELHAVRLGDISFVSNRFELYMDFMHRIQARSPFEQTFVVQLAATPGHDGGSYLATERGLADKGYSASIYCNLVRAQGGQELVEESLKLLNELSADQ